MDREFVPYEVALALKELGFDEKCGACYYKKFNNEIGYHKVYRDFNFVQLTVSAPTFSQAFRWFREKHNIVHTIYSNASGYIWELHYNQERGGTHICDSGETGDCKMSGMFTVYEKAELACLKKLIEIVKEKL